MNDRNMIDITISVDVYFGGEMVGERRGVFPEAYEYCTEHKLLLVSSKTNPWAL